MSKRTTTSAARQMLALNDCKVFDQHQWHAIFTVGQYLPLSADNAHCMAPSTSASPCYAWSSAS
jgi:hypothetical protein